MNDYHDTCWSSLKKHCDSSLLSSTVPSWLQSNFICKKALSMLLPLFLISLHFPFTISELCSLYISSFVNVVSCDIYAEFSILMLCHISVQYSPNWFSFTCSYSATFVCSITLYCRPFINVMFSIPYLLLEENKLTDTKMEIGTEIGCHSLPQNWYFSVHQLKNTVSLAFSQWVRILSLKVTQIWPAVSLDYTVCISNNLVVVSSYFCWQ